MNWKIPACVWELGVEGKGVSYLLGLLVDGFSYVCSFLYLKSVQYNLSVPYQLILQNSYFFIFLVWSVPPSIKLAVRFPLLALLICSEFF